MTSRVCPWWIGYLLLAPVRRWIQDPAAIVAPLVREEATVLEPGPGMGFFTLDLARRVGPAGRVVAVDLQQKMLDVLRRRARKAGLSERLDLRLARPEALGVDDLRGAVDLVFAFAVVHEMPNQDAFFSEARAALRPTGKLFLCEPAGHVSARDFQAELDRARRAGLALSERRSMRRSHAALLSPA